MVESSKDRKARLVAMRAEASSSVEKEDDVDPNDDDEYKEAVR